MSRVLTDRARTGAYIVSEANGARSRALAVLAEGNDLEAGTVVAEVSEDVYTALQAGGDGDEEAASVPAAILYDNVNALEDDVRAVFSVRDMEANGHELKWPEGFGDAEIAEAEKVLADKGIVVRR